MQEEKINYFDEFQSISEDTIKILGLDVDNMSVLGFITRITTLDNLEYKDGKFISIVDNNEDQKQKAELITKIINKNNEELNNPNHPLINLIVDSFLSQRANGVENLQIYINSIAFGCADASVIQAIMNPIINKAREKFKEITKEETLPNCDLIAPGTQLNSKTLKYNRNDVTVAEEGPSGNEKKVTAASNALEYIKGLEEFKDKEIAMILVDNDPKHYKEFVEEENFYAMPITRLLPAEVVKRSINYNAKTLLNIDHQAFEGTYIMIQNFDPNTVLYNAKGELSEYGKDLNVMLKDSKNVYLEAIESGVKLEIDGRENLNKSQPNIEIPGEGELSDSQGSVVNVEASEKLDWLENCNLSEHSNEEEPNERDVFDNTKSQIFKPGTKNNNNKRNLTEAEQFKNRNRFNQDSTEKTLEIPKTILEENPGEDESKIIRNDSNITGKFPSNITFADGGNIGTENKNENLNKSNIADKEMHSQVNELSELSSRNKESHHDERGSVETRTIKEREKVIDQKRERLANLSNDLSLYIKYKKLPWWKKFLPGSFMSNPGYDATPKEDTPDDLEIKIKSQFLQIQCIKNGLGKGKINHNIQAVNFKSRTIERLMEQHDINIKDLDIQVDNKRRIKSSITECYQLDPDKKKIGIKNGVNSYIPYKESNNGTNTKSLDDISISQRNNNIKQRNAYL